MTGLCCFWSGGIFECFLIYRLVCVLFFTKCDIVFIDEYLSKQRLPGTNMVLSTILLSRAFKDTDIYELLYIYNLFKR